MKTAVFVVSAMLVSASAALAQAPAQGDFPARPIRIIVPVAPGGVSDVVARAVGQRLGENLRQKVVIENRTGATHVIGASLVWRSPPDGYTLLVVEGVGLIVDLGGKLPYDPVKDFTAISGLVRVNHALIAHPSLPVADVRELLELARRRPGQLSYGSFGVGSSGHMNLEMLGVMSGTKLVPVHYRGASPALNDVMGGHIPLMLINLATAVQYAQTGKVRILGVGTGTRHQKLPGVPTIAEGGVAGYLAGSWFGLFGPAGLPKVIAERLNQEVQRIFAEPEFQSKVLAPTLFEPMAGTPDEFAALVRGEAAKWDGVVRKGNLGTSQP
ncbi:MAG: tripartite tricarboxylate transporter substrate binding protein [Pseudomonadota bacterium]